MTQMKGPQSAVSEVEQCTQHCKPATSPHLCECLHLATDGHIKWMEQMRRQIEILGRRPSTCGGSFFTQVNVDRFLGAKRLDEATTQ